jgi:hypothetical protein
MMTAITINITMIMTARTTKIRKTEMTTSTEGSDGNDAINGDKDSRSAFYIDLGEIGVDRTHHKIIIRCI